mgnify:CR=1 FL=1
MGITTGARPEGEFAPNKLVQGLEQKLASAPRVVRLKQLLGRGGFGTVFLADVEIPGVGIREKAVKFINEKAFEQAKGIAPKDVIVDFFLNDVVEAKGKPSKYVIARELGLPVSETWGLVKAEGTNYAYMMDVAKGKSVFDLTPAEAYEAVQKTASKKIDEIVDSLYRGIESGPNKGRYGIQDIANNILIDPATGEVRLIDPGLLTRLQNWEVKYEDIARKAADAEARKMPEEAARLRSELEAIARQAGVEPGRAKLASTTENPWYGARTLKDVLGAKAEKGKEEAVPAVEPLEPAVPGEVLPTQPPTGRMRLGRALIDAAAESATEVSGGLPFVNIIGRIARNLGPISINDVAVGSRMRFTSTSGNVREATIIGRTHEGKLMVTDIIDIKTDPATGKESRISVLDPATGRPRTATIELGRIQPGFEIIAKPGVPKPETAPPAEIPAEVPVARPPEAAPREVPATIREAIDKLARVREAEGLPKSVQQARIKSAQEELVSVVIKQAEKQGEAMRSTAGGKLRALDPAILEAARAELDAYRKVVEKEALTGERAVLEESRVQNLRKVQEALSDESARFTELEDILEKEGSLSAIAELTIDGTPVETSARTAMELKGLDFLSSAIETARKAMPEEESPAPTGRALGGGIGAMKGAGIAVIALVLLVMIALGMRAYAIRRSRKMTPAEIAADLTKALEELHEMQERLRKLR